MTDQGYQVEIAIPFDAIGIEISENTVIGFGAIRMYPRDERHLSSIFPRTESDYMQQLVQLHLK